MIIVDGCDYKTCSKAEHTSLILECHDTQVGLHTFIYIMSIENNSSAHQQFTF